VSIWAALGWMAASLALLAPMTRWFAARVQSLVLLLTASPTAALYVHFIVLLPGVALHEFSHWLSARLLGVRTGKVSLAPKARKGGAAQFGAVQLARADPLRESLIGLAPLLAGTAAVLALAHWRFGLDSSLALDPARLAGQLAQIGRARDTWLWVYLAAAIANAMWPSASDRRAWPVVGAYLGVGFILLALMGALEKTPPGVTAFAAARARDLAFAFTLTILLDIALGALLWLLEALFGRLLGRRVERK